jgi:hypothetical protein
MSVHRLEIQLAVVIKVSIQVVKFQRPVTVTPVASLPFPPACELRELPALLFRETHHHFLMKWTAT